MIELKENNVGYTNKPYNYKEGDLITLILNNGDKWRKGGKLLKGDKISKRHLLETFHNGSEYIFKKRSGDCVLIQYFSNYSGRNNDTHLWVHITEIHHPFQRQNSCELKMDYQCNNESIEFDLKVPLKLSFSFEEWKQFCENNKFETKYRTPKDGKIYDSLSDIPGEHQHTYHIDYGENGYEYFKIPTGITDFEIDQWKLFFSENKGLINLPIVDFTEEVKKRFHSKINSMVMEKRGQVVQNRIMELGLNHQKK